MCVFFSCNLLVCGRCGGFWCGGVVVSVFLCFFFFFGRCLEVEGEREENEERESEKS